MYMIGMINGQIKILNLTIRQITMIYIALASLLTMNDMDLLVSLRLSPPPFYSSTHVEVI